VDVIANRYCVITEDHRQPTLQSLLAAGRRLPYGAILTVVRSVTVILGTAHAAAIPAREIELGDLLVDPVTGTTKLVKLSTPRSHRLPSGTAGRDARPPRGSVAGDLYFVGCLLFRLLALAHPFRRRDEPESLAAERLAEVIKVDHGELSPAEIGHLVLLFTRATTASPDARYSTHEELLRSLDELELENADLLQARRRTEALSRRRRRAGLLATAFDTVAAFRGELRAPQEEAVAGVSSPLAPAKAPAAEPAGSDRHGDADPDRQAVGSLLIETSSRRPKSLLWDRHPEPGDGVLSWDDPAVLKSITAGSIGLCVAMLLWLLFAP
jgi:hypothetical protein